MSNPFSGLSILNPLPDDYDDPADLDPDYVRECRADDWE